MFSMRIGKLCTNIYCRTPSLIKYTTFNYLRSVKLSVNWRPVKRKILFCGICCIPIVAANKLKRVDVTINVKTESEEQFKMISEQSWVNSILRNGFFYIYEPLSIFIRILKVAFMFIPIILLFPITYMGENMTSIWWDVLLYIIEMSGPVFVKMGQWCSTRRDLLTENACKHLSKLQRQARPHSWQYTVYCMENAFGNNWSEIFVKFDNNQKPIGSGCIAQVYKAYMKLNALQDKEILAELSQLTLNKNEQTFKEVFLDWASKVFLTFESNKYLKEKMKERSIDKSTRKYQVESTEDTFVPVAIKILHPGIQRLFKQDIIILRGLALCASTLCPPLMWLSLPSCVNEFEKIMLPQFNLEIEAKNLETFSQNFEKVPSIKFPRPIRPFVTEKVLVESFEEGEAMNNLLKMDEDQKLKSRVAKIGVDALLKMIFKDNFVHADLHPGNIIVQKFDEPVAWSFRRSKNTLRLCLLDCGISSGLCEQDLIKFEAVFKEVVFGDGNAVGELFLSKSEHLCSDPENFKLEMNQLVTEARNEAVSLDKVDVGHLLQNISFLLMKHRIRLESAFSSVVLAVFVLEGLGRSLDKNIDILERAQPFLKL